MTMPCATVDHCCGESVLVMMPVNADAACRVQCVLQGLMKRRRAPYGQVGDGMGIARIAIKSHICRILHLPRRVNT